MTIVDNVDGSYIASDPADHCKHGVYVGGCGYDFMCHDCEMGYPDQTLRDAAARVDRLAREVWADWDRWAENFAGVDVGKDLDQLIETVMHSQIVRLQGAVVARDWIGTVCAGLDDDDYLARLHWARIEEYRRHQAERQEGSYL